MQQMISFSVAFTIIMTLTHQCVKSQPGFPPKFLPNDRKLFPHMENAPRNSKSFNSPGFYNPSYGFSKESFADIITRGTDYSSAEPDFIEEVPAETNVYARDYNQQNYWEELSEDIKNALQTESTRYESPQQIDSRPTSSYKVPFTFLDTLIQLNQRKNLSLNNNNYYKSLSKHVPGFDSEDKLTSHDIKDSYSGFSNEPYALADKYHEEIVKNHHLSDAKFGDRKRKNYRKPTNPLKSNGGPVPNVVPVNTQEISDLLEQSQALGEYLQKLKMRAEAEAGSRAARSGRQHPSQHRGGRDAYRPNKNRFNIRGL